MKAVGDFNYKVALASGLKNLQAGKLPQAEEHFRYLVSKFPTADGGYRGLARVLMSKDDTGAAVSTLRDGAAAMAKAGERTVAIDLLRECTTLDPLDLSSHRRLAAALALAGDVSAAAQEYVRFSKAQLDAGDAGRARMEAAYALQTFGEVPALHDLARSLGISLKTVRDAAGAGDVASEASVVEGAGGGEVEGRPDPARERRAEAAEPFADAEPARSDRVPGTGRPEDTSSPPAPLTQLAAPTPHEDPFVLEARAMALIGAHDPEAGASAIEATRALIAAGKVQAASDLLLQLVASGISVHDAERELIGVAHALGRDDIAEERSRLLGQAARLG